MYNNRLEKDDPLASVSKSTKWRLKKKIRLQPEVEPQDDSAIDDVDCDDGHMPTCNVVSNSKTNYNSRFKDDDPFESAPKTTKWRLKRKGVSADLDHLNNTQEYESARNPGEVNSSKDSEVLGADLEENNILVEDLEHSAIAKDFESDPEAFIDYESDQEDYFDCEDNSEWCEHEYDDLPNEEFSCDSEDGGSIPIYEGSSTTVAQSALLILTFALRHNLTGECLADLLSLIAVHCLSTNIIYSSLYKFRAYFSKLKSPLVFHTYCTVCECLLTKENDVCPNCESNIKESKNVSYFVEIPLAQQIKKLFERKTFHQDLNHRHTRSKKKERNLEDIYDGDLYKEYSEENAFLNNPNNLSFMWYTDGVPLFKSSKVGLWPLFLSINELPYHDRMKTENMLFAGLWFGKSKPSMSVFLKPFYESLKQVRDDGILVDCGHCAECFTVRGILLCGTCDLPAKCLMMNMAQFNGKFGCPRCKQEGIVVKTGKGHTRVFPFQEHLVDGPKRTHEEFIQHGENAFASSTSVFGVKGPSWWVNISADIIRGTAIDYMHTVLLGIVRRLLKLWFDPKFSTEAFSVSNFVDIADKRLACIKPPYFIKRHPRSIKEHSQYWKASECRSWLFYYSVPVLFGVLKKEVFEHYLLFVDAIFIMNLDSISPEELVHCEELLMKFCCLFSTLYGVNNMSANLHQLLHLHEVVRQLGPLWVYSCFSFESMNGKLLKLFHGTQSPAVQIANAVSTLMKLPALEQNINAETTVSELYLKLSSKSDRHKVTETICEGVHLIGATHSKIIQPNYYTAVAQFLKTAPAKCLVFYRLLIKGVLFQCSTYKVTSRNSYTVQFKMGSHILVGQIVFYVKCFPVCACNISCCRCAQFLAVVRKISVAEKILCGPDDIVTPKLDNIMSGVLTDNYVAIPVTDIIDLCAFVDFYRKDRRVFVCVRPNNIESD